MNTSVDTLYFDTEDFLSRRTGLAKKRQTKKTTFNLGKLNPIAYLARRRAQKKEVNSFMEAFEERNPDNVIFPFMAALVDDDNYHLLPDNYLFVKEDSRFIEQLTTMGFVPSQDLFPDNGFFKDELERTQTFTEHRYYHKDFNIEVHVVDAGDWQRLLSAKQIVDDLKTGDDSYMDRLICIGQSLLTLSANGPVV